MDLPKKREGYHIVFNPPPFQKIKKAKLKYGGKNADQKVFGSTKGKGRGRPKGRSEPDSSIYDYNSKPDKLWGGKNRNYTYTEEETSDLECLESTEKFSETNLSLSTENHQSYSRRHKGRPEDTANWELEGEGDINEEPFDLEEFRHTNPEEFEELGEYKERDRELSVESIGSSEATTNKRMQGERDPPKPVNYLDSYQTSLSPNYMGGLEALSTARPILDGIEYNILNWFQRRVYVECNPITEEEFLSHTRAMSPLSQIPESFHYTWYKLFLQNNTIWKKPLTQTLHFGMGAYSPIFKKHNKIQYSIIFMIRCVHEIMNRSGGKSPTAHIFRVGEPALKGWKGKWKEGGVEGLATKKEYGKWMNIDLRLYEGVMEWFIEVAVVNWGIITRGDILNYAMKLKGGEEGDQATEVLEDWVNGFIRCNNLFINYDTMEAWVVYLPMHRFGKCAQGGGLVLAPRIHKDRRRYVCKGRGRGGSRGKGVGIGRGEGGEGEGEGNLDQDPESQTSSEEEGLDHLGDPGETHPGDPSETHPGDPGETNPDPDPHETNNNIEIYNSIET